VVGAWVRRTRKIHQLRSAVTDASSEADLAGVALPALRSITGAEISSTIVLGPKGTAERPIWEPVDVPRRADMAAYQEFRRQQPLIRHYRRTPVAVPIRTTDITSVSEFRALDLHRHFYRPLEIDYQLAIAIDLGGGWTVAYTVSRPGPDFTDESCATMARVHAVLTAAHARLDQGRLRDRLGRVAELLWSGQAPGRCLVVLDRRGRLDTVSGELRAALERRYGSLVPGRQAPAAVAEFAGRSRTAWSSTTRVPGLPGPVDVTVVPLPPEATAVLFELRNPGGVRARYGLTAAEYRTLGNVVEYETNRRVADAEGVTVQTIQTRMSAIMAKLGVASRVGAVREYLRGA
jgi:DNA-binding CsgD family transcriptional regulator